MSDRPTVLFTHGLWMTGVEATLFRRGLAARGFAVRPFHYQAVGAAPADVLAALRAEVLALPPPVHLVGHSLGGLLLVRLVELHPELPLAASVLLGSPVNGSRAARGFARIPGASLLFGPLAEQELLGEQQRHWRHAAPVGVIAGSWSFGFGRFLGGLPVPNDGTVAVDETRLDGATEQLVLPVSHLGLLLSDAALAASVSFLRRGRFGAPDP